MRLSRGLQRVSARQQRPARREYILFTLSLRHLCLTIELWEHDNARFRMVITRLEIRNFRGIEQLTLPLDDLCVLIGENNAGKSTVLDAVRICLTRPIGRSARVFEEYDYHLPD